MAESNLFCSFGNCGQQAEFFGFRSDNTKLKVCKDHLNFLTKEQIAFFDISAFRFLDCESDQSLFQQRRAMVQKGLGNVAAMETQCDADWREGQTCIQRS